MVAYIKSDLEFILKQIKIAEAHAAFTQGVPTGDPLISGQGSVRTQRVDPDLQSRLGSAHGRRHLQQPAARPEWGAADNPFPEPLGTQYKTIMVPAGPGGALVPVSYQPGVDNDGPGTAGPSDVFDPYVRTISNLIVDQTLGNPAAILTGLQRAGIVDPAQSADGHRPDQRRSTTPLKPLFNAVNDAARAECLGAGGGLCKPRTTWLCRRLPRTHRCRPRLPREARTRRGRRRADDPARLPHGIELDGANIVDHQRRARRRPVGAVQFLVHAVRPVLRSRPRPRRQGRQRHRVHSAACRTTRSTWSDGQPERRTSWC